MGNRQGKPEHIFVGGARELPAGRKRGSGQSARAPALAASSLLSWRAATYSATPYGLLDQLWHPAGSSSDGEGEEEPRLRLAADTGSGSGFQLDFPCVLRPAVGGAKGLDLRLQLVSLQIGEPFEPAALSSSSGGVPRCQQPRQQDQPPLLAVVDKAACLLAARLLFPEAAVPALRLLAAAHCAAAAARVAGLAVSPAARAAARRRLQRVRESSPLVGAAACGACQLGSLAQRYGEPAAVLLAAAALWAYVHPTSAQIGECIAALIPVLAGYNQTAKHCATSRLSGNAAEELWRRRHKWAARRTAKLLTDLPDTPPLAPLISAWEGLNICIAAVVDEQHFGSIDGWSASGGGLQVAASVGARGQAAARERRSTLAPVPGHVAATPAPPLEGLEAGGERQGGEAVDVVEAQQAQHDLVSHSATQQEAWEAARLALAGGTRAKGGLCDSPSEMHTPRDCPPWQGAEQAQQGTQGGGGGGGGGDGDPLQPASRSTSRSASGSSSNGTRGVLDDAAEAALREAAADFMHPARWAAARAAPAHPDQAGAAAHSFSTRSLSGGSWHSFLVPGAQLSSEASSQVDGAEGPPPGVAALPQGTAAAEQPAVGGEGELLQPAGWTAHAAADDQPLSVADRLALALRAAHLLALFAPFLLLGTLLLLVAARLAEGSPAAGRLRTRAFKLLLWACSQSGAAFIKWAQWSATRTDIFPGDFCRVMSSLHDQAPVHSEGETKRAVEAAFKAPLEELFESFEAAPLASGSIAQVHRARLLVGGCTQEVAVKVRHPGVARQIWQDFQLLRPLAALTAHVRSLRSLNLAESVSQFSHTMAAQADLRIEAAHLRRAFANFSSVTSSVHVPRTVEGYCTEDVLVESFEAGQSVANFIRTPHPQNTQIVALGVDTYLKMLLQDNFVHTDLHPGNILVRAANNGRGDGPASSGNEPSGGDSDGGASDGASSGGGNGDLPSQQQRQKIELILIDFGLCQELTPVVRHRFISFLFTIAAGNGRSAARHLLCWAERQRCPDPAAFAADMEALFTERADIFAPEGIDLDAVIKSVLQVARRHEVSIDTHYAELVLGVCVIVGFATSLDRRVNMMDAAAPVMLYYSLTGRITGRLYM